MPPIAEARVVPRHSAARRQGGCTYPGAASGVKPEAKRSKADIAKQIEQLQANDRVPAGIKATALQKLQKELADAR